MNKNYEKLQSSIEEGFDVHHIDWNKKNDDIDNLIVIPRKIHQLVHEYLGYVDRGGLIGLVKKFESSRNYRKKKISYLNYKLSEYVDIDKTSELAISCKERLGKLKEPKKGEVNYRQLYIITHGKIDKGWEVHHIDWNHDNSVIDNLFAIPKRLHELVHRYLGYVDRDELEILLEAFNKSTIPPTASLGYLNEVFSLHVDTNKTHDLARKCKVSMDYNINRYHNAYDWLEGKRGMI